MEKIEKMDKFIKYIEEIYNILLQPIDNIYKRLAIENYKRRLQMETDSFSKVYCRYIDKAKEKGVVYTPLEIADYIVRNSITSEDIIVNPFIRIMDPACGSGNLIIPCYKYLLEVYVQNLDTINEKHNLKLTKDTLPCHIVKNNLFGFDIDKTAIKVLLIDLFYISGFLYEDNFAVSDFLLEAIDKKFDIYISNPPYIGHKAVEREYSTALKRIYKKIYKDKGDISYCFFQKALMNVTKGGKLAFITSRYFLEAPSGEELRKIIKELCYINKIVDFYGIRPFKNVGIDPVIIFLKNEHADKNPINVIKPVSNKNNNKKLFYSSLFFEKGKNYKQFYLEKNLLSNKGWILRDEKERTIINKIEKKSFTNLFNICDSFQGIITGCDKAFVLDTASIEDRSIERELLRPWLKSSFINKNTVSKREQFLIYSDLIGKEEEYPNAIEYIKLYKDKLLNRRECRKGCRKWYELQWGRERSVFEGKKIIFPYKADSNRFAIDSGSFFSADIYALRLKENVPFTYEYLLFILNSKVYEFYFKTFAKKLGEALYEYYPNNLMKLCIPTMQNLKGEEDLYNIFEFTDEEIVIINNQN